MVGAQRPGRNPVGKEGEWAGMGTRCLCNVRTLNDFIVERLRGSGLVGLRQVETYNASSWDGGREVGARGAGGGWVGVRDELSASR